MKKIVIILLTFVSVFNLSIVAEPIQVIIDGKIFNPGEQHGGMPRNPDLYPNVWQDNHVFTADSLCYGALLRLVQGDNIVYQTIVSGDDNGVVVIPDEISGTFELQVFIGNYVFFGYVTL